MLPELFLFYKNGVMFYILFCNILHLGSLLAPPYTEIPVVSDVAKYFCSLPFPLSYFGLHSVGKMYTEVRVRSWVSSHNSASS